MDNRHSIDAKNTVLRTKILLWYIKNNKKKVFANAITIVSFKKIERRNSSKQLFRLSYLEFICIQNQ